MKKKQSFFRSIGRDNCYIVFNLYYAYFALGLALIMLGSVLPMMKAEYDLNYQIGGMLLSVQSVGYAAAGLGAGFLPMYLGMKNSFISMTSGIAIGLIMLLISGNPVWLLIAMALIGIAKGAITNYNNQIMSSLANGNAGPLNLLHAFFAIGACIAPVVVLICSKFDASGWRLAATIGAAMAIIGLLAMTRMKLDSQRGEKTEKTKVSYGFFREKIFWVIMVIVFFYQCIEASMMGWVTTYFVDTGAMSDSFAQVVTSALWIALLVGRLSCSQLSKRFRPYQMILVMAVGQLLFLLLLVMSHSFGMLMLATVGLGLSMSGMYGTSVSDAGDLFIRYPVCMGFFVLLTSMGAVVAPALVGFVANLAGMRAGMAILLIAAAALLGMSLYDARNKKKHSTPRFL